VKLADSNIVSVLLEMSHRVADQNFEDL